MMTLGNVGQTIYNIAQMVFNTSNATEELKKTAFSDPRAVSTLLEAKADVNKAEALHRIFTLDHTQVTSYACMEECVKLLLDAQGDVNVTGKVTQKTPLSLACQDRHIRPGVMKALLRAKANVNVVDDNGWTALHYCANSGSAEVIKVLVEGKANLEFKDTYGQTALHFASAIPHVWSRASTRQLVSAKADIWSENDYNRQCPILDVAQNRPHQLVDMLMGAPSSSGLTIMMVAALYGHEETVNNCLEREEKVDVHEKDMYGSSALMLSLIRPFNEPGADDLEGHFACARLLASQHGSCRKCYNIVRNAAKQLNVLSLNQLVIDLFEQLH